MCLPLAWAAPKLLNFIANFSRTTKPVIRQALKVSASQLISDCIERDRQGQG